jgi:hypothetical protein
MESKPPTIAAAAAAAIPTIMRGLRNHRSWVQIPPGPFLSALEIRYYFEFILIIVGQKPYNGSSILNRIVISFLVFVKIEGDKKRVPALPAFQFTS